MGTISFLVLNLFLIILALIYANNNRTINLFWLFIICLTLLFPSMHFGVYMGNGFYLKTIFVFLTPLILTILSGAIGLYFAGIRHKTTRRRYPQ